MTLKQILFVLGVLAVHWFADFVCQTREQANGKSKNFSFLVQHTATYTLIWGLVLMTPCFKMGYPLQSLIAFTIITFIVHTVQDYYTSKANLQLWKTQKQHAFWSSVGFDQLLHYVQLFLTFYLLT